MPVTPDLAPGARSRVWMLLSVTAVMGVATYVVFERWTGLFVAGTVFAVLLYLLLGVRLTLNAERKRVLPIVERLAEQNPDYLLIIDEGGTVLKLSDAGADALAHTREVLEGQRLADLVPMVEGEARSALAELLRFAPTSNERHELKLPLLAEDGTPRRVHIKTGTIVDPQARKARLIVITQAD